MFIQKDHIREDGEQLSGFFFLCVLQDVMSS